MSPQRPSYAVYWRENRRRWYLFFALWIGFVPFAFVVSRLRDDDTLPNWAFWSWGILWLWSGTRLGPKKCPRCGRPFLRRGWYSNGFALKCMHCGLPRGAETDPDWSPPK